MNLDDARAAVLAALAIVAPEIDPSDRDASAPMSVELELDSMDVFSLVTELAASTGTEIPDGEITSNSSLDDLVERLAAA